MSEPEDINVKVQKYKRMIALIENLTSQMEKYKDQAYWAAEIRSIINEQSFLYRCPIHGDREMSMRISDGICCGVGIKVPEYDRFHNVHGTCCRTAIFIGATKRII